MDTLEILRGILGLYMSSERLRDQLQQFHTTEHTEPTTKIYSDAVYTNYFDLGMSIMYVPKADYRPRTGIALDHDKLELRNVDIYNFKEKGGGKKQSYAAFAHLPLFVGGPDDKTLKLDKDTTGKEIVDALGEPSRKGGGDGPSGGSIGIWCEWSNLGLMFEFESRGPQAWEMGKDSTWNTVTIFAPEQA
ncbi:hypothetical protein FRC15_007081 [Serendipita sp. 397]|nr:hypothetical protein FRC15_007081 [Serendipita sp. 397]